MLFLFMALSGLANSRQYIEYGHDNGDDELENALVVALPKQNNLDAAANHHSMRLALPLAVWL
jgi:hypothetical protein